VDDRAVAQVEALELGRRVAAVETGQRAGMTLADQQPVGMQALELAGLGDVGNGNDGAGAASERVSSERRR